MTTLKSNTETLKDKPRRPGCFKQVWFWVVMACVATGLIPYLGSATFRISVLSILFETKIKTIQHWSINQLSAEPEAASAALIRIQARYASKIAHDPEANYALSKLNPRVRYAAVSALLNTSNDVNYCNLDWLGNYVKDEAHNDILASEHKAIEGCSLILSTGQTHSFALYPIHARSVARELNFAQTNSCPDLSNLYIELLWRNHQKPKQLSVCPIGLFKEALEPQALRRSANMSHSARLIAASPDYFNGKNYIHHSGILNQSHVNDYLLTRRNSESLDRWLVALGFDNATPSKQAITTPFYNVSARRTDGNKDLSYCANQLSIELRSRRNTLAPYTIHELTSPAPTSMVIVKYAIELALWQKSGQPKKIVDATVRLAEVYNGFDPDMIEDQAYFSLYLSSPKMNYELANDLARRQARMTRTQCNNMSFLVNKAWDSDLIHAHNNPKIIGSHSFWTESLLAQIQYNPDSVYIRNPRFIKQWLDSELDERKVRWIKHWLTTNADLSWLESFGDSIPPASRNQLFAQLKQRKQSHANFRVARSNVAFEFAKTLPAGQSPFGFPLKFSVDPVTTIKQLDYARFIATKKQSSPAYFKHCVSQLSDHIDLLAIADWPSFLQSRQFRRLQSESFQEYDLPDVIKLAKATPAEFVSDYLKLAERYPVLISGIPVLKIDAETKRSQFLTLMRNREPGVSTCSVASELNIDHPRFYSTKIASLTSARSELYWLESLLPTTAKNLSLRVKRIELLVAYVIANDPEQQFPLGRFPGPVAAGSDTLRTAYFKELLQSPVANKFDLGQFQDLLSISPDSARHYWKMAEQTNRKAQLQALKHLRASSFLAKSAIEDLCKSARMFHEYKDYNFFGLLLLALTEVDRRGETAIPTLVQIAKDKSRSYLFRAFAICCLRRYYETSKTDAVLTKLIPELSGDLRVLAQRSLDFAKTTRERFQ